MSTPGEHARRRRTTRHLLLSASAVVLFGCAILALYWVGRPSPAPEPSQSPSPTVSPDPQQPTLLIQVTSGDGAAGNILTGLDLGTSAGATGVVLPAGLVVSASGIAPEPLRQTVVTLDTLRPSRAVATTLGVRVDAAWRLDRKALAGLVDAVGGVVVDLPAPLRIRDSQDVVVLRLKAGRQRLSGASASWYAVGRVDGEPEPLATRRFRTIMIPALAKLPEDDLAIRETLTALGALAPSTIGTQELSVYLLGLATAFAADEAEVFALPSRPLVLGGTTLRWADYNRATPLLREHLPLAQWTAGVDGPPRSLVMTGRAEPGIIGSTRTALEEAGQEFVDGRGTRVPNSRSSRIQVRDETDWGDAAARALGLDEGLVRTVDGARRPWADVDVVLGADYVPVASTG